MSPPPHPGLSWFDPTWRKVSFRLVNSVYWEVAEGKVRLRLKPQLLIYTVFKSVTVFFDFTPAIPGKFKPETTKKYAALVQH